MSIKDLFGQKSNKIVTSQDSENVSNEIESKEIISSEIDKRKTFIPRVNFLDPKQFAKYGLAEKYYVDSVENIYNTYPYDGSEKEQIEWNNSASQLDKFLLDNGYPRTTGHVLLNSSYTLSATQTVSDEVFKINTSPQYITFNGGMNASTTDGASSKTGTKRVFSSRSNVKDETKNRSSNLDISHDLGNTVEFWYKIDSTSSLQSQSTCLFDLWNEQNLDDSSYGRFLIEILGTVDGVSGSVYPTTGSFSVSYLSGSTGASRIHVGAAADMPSGWSLTNWHHYSFVVKSNSTDNNTKVKFYVDGNLITETTTSTTAITASIDNGLQASLGAYLEGPTVASTSSVTAGYGTLENSYFDEFRFWRKARTDKEIKRNWFKQVRGGTNTDDSNVELGVYYKFNEGVINTGSIDSRDATVLDYSGRITNGSIQNYSLATRITSSAFSNEEEDPIIRSVNYRVVDYKQTLQDLGNNYDQTNVSSMMNYIPKWITDIDEKKDSQLLKELTQIMSSYMDTMYLQIEALPTLKNPSYSSLKSGSFPHYFVKESLGSTGFINPDLFIDATVLEEISSRNEELKFSENIHDIKNSIYQNIYNNIPHIFKSKGTEKSYRNLIRCFGIDEELLKVNLYSDNSVYTFDEDNARTLSYKKQYANFNNTSSFGANVYQYADPSNANSAGFIVAKTNELDYIPYTLQCEVFFPKKFSYDVEEEFITEFTQVSLFGLHGANTSSASDTTWPSDDAGNLQVYFVREDSYSKNGHFRLEFSGSSDVVLTSSVYTDVYDNEKWNLAVRLKPNLDITNLAPYSDNATNYTLEFYGVNSESNIVQSEFLLTSSISDEAAQKALNNSKRIYAGAYRTNFTGSLQYKSDANISSVRFWADYLNNDTIKYHAKDASTHGRIDPFKPANFTVTSLTGSKGGIRVPQSDTLLLNWNFQTVTGSDSSGNFIVVDYSSGSLAPYGWFSDLSSKEHTGKGNNFPSSYSDAVVQRYINILKTSQPEVMNNSDMVKVLTQDDEFFTRDTTPVKHYFAIEKSMYQAISDEMLRTFAGIRYFNDMIGNPANRYRMEYKDLRNLRQLFFKNVNNTPSLEKYIEYYKWIDSSISNMIMELLPATAKVSGDGKNLVESHILERNKYWNKFPTLDTKAHEPVANLRGINELTYDWEHGHRLLDPSGTKNTLFNKERAIRSDSDISSSDTNVDSDRESIRKSSVREVKGNTKLLNSVEKDIELYDQTTSTSYEISTYATRRLSKPYRFKLEIDYGLKGGPNSHQNKVAPFEFIKTATPFLESKGLESSDAVVNNNSEDEADRFRKFKADSDSLNTNEASGSVNKIKGSLVNPFSEYSETVTGTPKITNNLFDAYGKDREVPMQGPFTQTHVGGNQHRHIELNRGETLDDASTRAELYVDTDSSETSSKLYHPAYSNAAIPSARILRDGTAKRPLNIKNIKHTTGSFFLGNYNKDYEIISANGRSSQNRWFVKNEGRTAFTSSVASTAVTDTRDFILPDRTSVGTSDHVMVQRFSAPGGTDVLSRRMLDGEAEEFSVYNSMNYRNLLVRRHLRKKLQTHSDKFGYEEGQVTGSFQKVQRNTSKRIRLTGSLDTEVELKNTYDNSFVSFQIPRSEYQYAWVTSSADSKVFGSLQFNHYGFSSDYYNVAMTASFVLSGSLSSSSGIEELDFAGLNTNIYEPISLKTRTLGYNNFFTKYKSSNYVHRFLDDSSVTNFSKATQLNALLLHRNGPYQHPMWKQVRNVDNPFIKFMRKRNLISTVSKQSVSTKGEKFVEVVEHKNFKEPVVTWNLPAKTNLKVSSGNKTEEVKVTYPFANNTETFANPSLKNEISVETNDTSAYKELLTIYDDENNPISFSRLLYNEQIFPKKRNVGLSFSRKRKYYEESESTLRKSPGVINTFWKDLNVDRIKPNRSSNALDAKFSIGQIGFFKQLDSFWSLDNFTVTVGNDTYDVLGDLAYVGIERYRDWIYSGFNSHEASPFTRLGTNTAFATAGVLKSRGKASPSEVDTKSKSSYTKTSYVTDDVSTKEDYKYPSIDAEKRNTQFDKEPDLAIEQSLSFSDEGESKDPVIQTLSIKKSFMGKPVSPESSDEPGKGGGDISFAASMDDDFMADNGYVREAGLRNGVTIRTEIAEETDGDGRTTTTGFGGMVALNPGPQTRGVLEPEFYSLPPRPAIQFNYNPYHSILGESGMKWKTSLLSGKNPWYDSYDDYSLEISKIGQNYSILPEFKVSEHIDYYVNERKGNFKEDNYGFLTLLGSGDTSKKISSAKKVLTIGRSYSRDGYGAFDVVSYPSSSASIETKDIQNNAWYVVDTPERNVGLTTFRDFNNAFVPDESTFTISSSHNTFYNITKTFPETGLNSDGDRWITISPHMKKNAGALFNLEDGRNDFIQVLFDKINSENSSSLSLHKESSSTNPGTPFCVSFWASLDSKALEEEEYIGAWNVSMNNNKRFGLWLKAPKAGDWGGSSTSRGITFFIGNNQPDSGKNDSNVYYSEDIYEFFNEDGTEASLTAEQLHHVVMEFVPSGSTSSPAYVRMFLDGNKLYGKHIKYANYDSGSSGIAYSACPIGAYQAWDQAETYGTALDNNSYGSFNKLQIGKSSPDVPADRKDLFKGFMDEFSMWYGTLTSDDVTRMNYYSHPSNLIEEYANSEITGTTGSWDYEFGANAPLIGTDSNISYTRPASGFTFKSLEFPMWSRVGVPYYEEPSSLKVDYDSDFFDKYCHTDYIKFFDKVSEDHKNKKQKVRLKVNAIKKLLPYNGFYPNQRTVQLSYLFKESYKNSITLRNPLPPNNKEGFHSTQALQSLIQPFFAPGILYNTIKSGVAVDFPLFTNESGIEPSRPRPLINVYGNDEQKLVKQLNLFGPSWYFKNDPQSFGLLSNPDAPQGDDVLRQFRSGQPKDNISGNATTNEGFVIIKEPNARLGFEKIIEVESAFYNENSLNHLTAEPTKQSINIFHNVVIEFTGYEIENNTITIRQPVVSENGRFGDKEFNYHFKHDDTLVAGEITANTVGISTVIRANFLENSEDSLTQLIGRRFLDEVNKNKNVHFGAIDSREIDFNSNSLNDLIKRSFEDKQEIIDLQNLQSENTTYKVKLIYLGFLNLTFNDYISTYAPTNDASAFGNDLIAKELYFSKASSEILDPTTPSPIRETGGVLLPSDRLLEPNLLEENSNLLKLNGFGEHCRISLKDEGDNKVNGAYGILGIRYVTELGETESISDNSRFIPMLQLKREFYNSINFAVTSQDITEISGAKIKKKPHQVFLMAPEYYTGSIDENDWVQNTRYPYFEWTGKSPNPVYKMAMHNFLAETPKFFLKNRGMTTIASAPQNQFKKMEIGKKYYMNIVMYKTENFHTVYSPFDGGAFEVGDKGGEKIISAKTHGRYFGPAFKYKDNSKYNDSEELIMDPAFAPYTPPYFYGKTVARVVYVADKENPTIDDIHRDMYIENVDDEIIKEFIRVASLDEDPDSVTDQDNYGIKDSPAYKSRMTLESSVNFKGKTRLKNITYNVSGVQNKNFNASQATDSSDSGDDVWVISPKFECPVMNFNPETTTNTVELDEKEVGDISPNKNTSGTGIWHGYGELPSSQEGIFISIEESYNYSLNEIAGKDKRKFYNEAGEEVGSLIDVCGFRSEVSKIGELAEETTVSEAVIMIPFIDSQEKDTAPTISVMNRNFFKVSKDKFDYQKSNILQDKPAVEAGKYGATQDLQETSISRMARLMDKYYIPPKLDFVTYDTQPFVMYIFEFNHTFDQKDLADIWQNVMPKSAQIARHSDEEDDNVIEHELGTNEFFEGNKIPEKVRWMTFKVKQKGEKNYYNVTADSKDDSRFKFDFQVGKRAPEYSYNWPYDYFTLVESVGIEGGLVVEEPEEQASTREGNTGVGSGGASRSAQATLGTSDTRLGSQKLK